MANKIVIKSRVIDTIKSISGKWAVSDWERSFMDSVLFSNCIYAGISQKQYNKLNSITSAFGYDLSGSITVINEEYEATQRAIDALRREINKEKPFIIGPSYDFAERMEKRLGSVLDKVKPCL